jgi:hypothetical protein
MQNEDSVRTPIYQIDAFTTRRFTGNPAAVMLLEAFPPDATLQAIAAENNLAETIGCAGLRQQRRFPFAATPRWPALRWSWSVLNQGAPLSSFTPPADRLR